MHRLVDALNITGYGMIEVKDDRPQIIEAGVVRSKRTESFPKRLASIYHGIDDVIKSLKPDCMGLEELYSHYQRPKTSIIMGHARGVICLAAEINSVEVQNYAATQIKRVLTGSGRASKIQMQQAVTQHFNLDEVPQPPDVADALSVALCHYYLSIRPNSLT